MRNTVIVFLFIVFFLYKTSLSFAESPYVLPYPSVMPGGVSYKLHLVWEKVLGLLDFGSFGQFEYNLHESDKYLVESKTLFEYKQYLLGFKALQQSNLYFKKIYPSLLMAEKEGKDISEKVKIFQDASEKHIEVLKEMKNNVPKDFLWNPEKTASSKLQLWQLIDDSINQRTIKI